MTNLNTLVVCNDPKHPALAAFPADIRRSTTIETEAALDALTSFTEWTSLVYLVEPSNHESFIRTDVHSWFEEVETRLGTVLSLVQKSSALMKDKRGRVLLVWEENDGRQADAQAAICGGLVSMVKALSLDFGPHFIGINGLVIPKAGPGRDPSTLRSCIDFLSTRRAEAMIGQVLLPGSTNSATSWGTW